MSDTLSADVLGIVTDAQERRERYGRFAYRAPVSGDAPPFDLKALIEAAVEQHMKADTTKKQIERMVISALTEQAERWRAKQLASFTDPAELPSIDSILALASDITGVSIEEFQCPTRVRRLAWPRHFGMMLLHHARRDLSLPLIGKVFGGRDHSTVSHGLQMAEKRRGYPEYAAWYADPRAVAILNKTGTVP